MNKKINLIGKLSITYAFLLSLCFLFYALIVLPEKCAEIVNAKVGLLGWSATIFAPIAAYFLIDNWKDQRKYELENEYLSNIIKNLKPIFSELIIIRNNSSIIKRTRENYILYNEFITRNNFNFHEALIDLYPDIIIYSKIKNDDFLETTYYQFDKKCLQIEIKYRDLIGLYSKYYDKCISISPRLQNKGTANDIKDMTCGHSDTVELKLEIRAISDFLELDQGAQIENIHFQFKFLDYIEETIKMYESILNYCIDKIKLDTDVC